MSLPTTLDVAIGLALMYLMLSLAVTTIGELVSTFMSLRARSLSRTITMLIDDDDIRKRFYNHGLIASSKTAARGGDPAKGASAAPDADVDRPREATNAAGVPKDKQHPSYFDSRTFAMALLDSLSAYKAPAEKDKADGQQPDGGDQGAPSADPILRKAEDVRKLVAKLPKGSKLRDVLLTHVTDGEQSVEKVRDGVAKWFDSTMDRLTGDFARQSKRIALGIGVLLAVAVNADSIAVTKALWSDRALRENLVQTAASLGSTAGYMQGACAAPEGKQEAPVASNDGSKSDAATSRPASPAPRSAAGEGSAEAANKKSGAAPVSAAEAERIKCLLGELDRYETGLRPLPLGWYSPTVETWWIALTTAGWSGTGLWLVVLKAFGLMLTGLALSLGAPFWFDLLQRFMSIRGSGPKPEKHTQR